MYSMAWCGSGPCKLGTSVNLDGLSIVSPANSSAPSAVVSIPGVHFCGGMVYAINSVLSNDPDVYKTGTVLHTSSDSVHDQAHANSTQDEVPIWVSGSRGGALVPQDVGDQSGSQGSEGTTAGTASQEPGNGIITGEAPVAAAAEVSRPTSGNTPVAAAAELSRA